jgi:hypothetical protein
MATNSIPRKTSKIWYYFTERSNSTARCNFCSKSISFKGGNLSNHTRYVRRAHPAVSLSIERLTHAHSPAGNETRNTNPDNPEIVQLISSNESTKQYTVTFLNLIQN